MRDYTFDNNAEYMSFISAYCNYLSIDEVEHLMILNVYVGQDDNYDLIDLQYLVELVMKLKKLGQYELVLLCFDADEANYRRISQILRLWYLFHADNNSVWFREGNTGSGKPKRIAVKDGKKISKILPLCQLSPRMWEVFSCPGVASESEIKIIDMFFDEFSESADSSELSQKDIISKINKKHNWRINEEYFYRLIISRFVRTKNNEYYEMFKESDCLTHFIFSLYICNRNATETLNHEELTIIHEICKSYSQGILQLIENSLIHPRIKSEPYCFFSFRENSHAERLDKYIQNPEDIDSLLEFSVSDFSLVESEARGIVSSFAEKHPELNNVKLDAFFDFTYSDEANALQLFYKSPDNAVNHFGLQIFANIVRANNGCFTVTSIETNKKPDSYFSEGKRYKYNNVRTRCFPGTTYTIILPIEKEFNAVEPQKTYRGNTPLLATINAIENDWGEYKYFDNPLSKEIASLTIDNREEKIERYCTELKGAYESWGKPTNICLLVNYTNYNSVIVFCKAVFAFLLKNDSVSKIVLFFNNKSNYYMAIRTCCLFYDRVGRCDLMNKNKGLFLYNTVDNAQAYLSGKSLGSIVNSLSNQYLNGLIDSVVKDQIEAIYGCQLSNVDYEEYNNDICIKMRVKHPAKGKPLLEEELIEILSRDIHENNIGCKISNTHFRLSKVHLDTYYEAQFLFGNSYWCMVFATFLADRIREKITNTQERIVIYGYEKYSAETLSLTRELLHGLKYDSVELLFYENGDPELDTDRVRFVESLLEEEYSVCYFVGISSTLSTFEKMDVALDNAVEKLNLAVKLNKVLCSSAIQIIENEEATDYKPLKLVTVTGNNTVQSEKVDFVPDSQASFFVSILANWYEPQNCKHCLTGKLYKKTPFRWDLERPLIEVDETSVIPTLLYKTKGETKPSNSRSDFNFLWNLRDEEFLYAEHLKRKENHYQYFLRLAHIYATHRDDIRDWLINLKSETEVKAWIETIHLKGTINILISPQQNSNNGFVDDVNQIIFDGGAHTIIFDIRKEYRESFIAKYKYLTERLVGKSVSFYYVADHIITGKTYHRTQSLIKSLFNGMNTSFSGVFVLVNRNSLRSQQALIDRDEEGILPYFSFINLSIPALRSHNCPACNLVSQYNTALKNSASVYIALEYQKKILSNRVKTLKEIHELYNADPDKKKELFKRNSNKLFIENKLWDAFSVMNNSTVDDLVRIILPEFEMLSNNSDRIEKLCILIEVIIEPLLIYQEEVKNIAFELIHQLYEETMSVINGANGTDILSKLNIDLLDSLSSYKQNLLEQTIWGLCYMGSSQFLFFDSIKNCFKVKIFSKIDKPKYEKRLISYIKFLLANDKLREFSFQKDGKLIESDTKGAKSQILISNLCEKIDTKDWSENSAFWDLLYIESTSINTDSLVEYLEEKAKRHPETSNNRIDGLPPKYRDYINTVLNNKCVRGSSISLLVYVDHLFFNLESFSQISLEQSCMKSFERNGFYEDKDNNQWYFPITNNVSYFEKEETPPQIIRELIGTTNVLAIIVITPCGTTRLERLEAIRRILLYRYELVKMLEDDYEEEFFSRSYKFARMIDVTRKILGSHGSINWNDYQGVLDCTYKNITGLDEKIDDSNEDDEDIDPDPSGFFMLMNIARNAFISFANQVDSLNLNMDDINFRYNSIHEIDDALKVVNDVVKFYSNKLRLNIDYKCDFHKKTNTKYKYIMFGSHAGVGYFFLGIFAFIYLDNALNHADTEKPIYLSIEKCDESEEKYKMVMRNTRSKKPEANSSVTVSAITRLFEIISKGSVKDYPEVKVDDGKSIPDEYKIELTNIIIVEEVNANEGSCDD